MADSDLRSSLMRELFQTEYSATHFPRIEAERLGDVPPSLPMLAVAAHGSEMLEQLPALARARGIPTSVGGLAAGVGFVSGRNRFSDLLFDSEMSYRATLLGMRHGIDVVQLLRHTAREEGDLALAEWCDAWLRRRIPLVESVAAQLTWFGHHPQEARAPARSSLAARAARLAVRGIGVVEQAVSAGMSGLLKGPLWTPEPTSRDTGPGRTAT